MSWIEKTVLFTFVVWGYFYAKYNFYQNSINEHEQDQEEKVHEVLFMRKYLEFKLKIPPTVNLSEEELLNEYGIYARNQLKRNAKLDVMLTNINSTTFDKPSF